MLSMAGLEIFWQRYRNDLVVVARDGDLLATKPAGVVDGSGEMAEDAPILFSPPLNTTCPQNGLEQEVRPTRSSKLPSECLNQCSRRQRSSVGVELVKWVSWGCGAIGVFWYLSFSRRFSSKYLSMEHLTYYLYYLRRVTDKGI